MAFSPHRCRCWMRPFEPPEGCFDYCAAQFLHAVHTMDLQQHLFIEPELAEKIVNITTNKNLKSLSEFRAYLHPEEFREIAYRIRNIDPTALARLMGHLGRDEDNELPTPISI